MGPDPDPDAIELAPLSPAIIAGPSSKHRPLPKTPSVAGPSKLPEVPDQSTKPKSDDVQEIFYYKSIKPWPVEDRVVVNADAIPHDPWNTPVREEEEMRMTRNPRRRRRCCSKYCGFITKPLHEFIAILIVCAIVVGLVCAGLEYTRTKVAPKILPHGKDDMLLG